ncbi:MAG: hypothetical protein P8Z80_14790 [Pseudolabrys sp.]
MYGGATALQSFQFAKDIDTAMRTNYAANIVNIGQNIYPLLYVESTFDGGRYTLLTDRNTRYVHQNVGQVYDVLKAVSHITLGIFSITSAYWASSSSGQWVPALKAYREQIVKVRDTKDEISDLNDEEKRKVGVIVDASLEYIDKLIASKYSNPASFKNYARGLNREIYFCQNRAAKNQVEVMTAVLTNWQEMMGDDAWDKMYVIIGAVWTLTQENAHELIIKALMKPGLRETHVMVSEAVPDLEAAQTLMGRIIGDRIMAACVFDVTADTAFAEDVYSLSTRRDLLSQAVEAIVGDVAKSGADATDAVACPHLRS